MERIIFHTNYYTIAFIEALRSLLLKRTCFFDNDVWKSEQPSEMPFLWAFFFDAKAVCKTCFAKRRYYYPNG